MTEPSAEPKFEPMSEAELAKRVVAHLESHGFTVYQEVQIPRVSAHRADIVAVKGTLIVVVECKTKLSFELLAQARYWIGFANRVYIAVPIATQTFKARSLGYRSQPTRMEAAETDGRRLACQLVRHLKLGMLEVAHADIVESYRVRPIHQRVPAAYREVDTELRDVLEPEHQTHARAGTDRAGHWTPFKKTCALVRAYLREHPEASLLEAMRAVPHHYASGAKSGAASLAACVDKGVAPGLARDPESKRIVPVPVEGEPEPLTPLPAVFSLPIRIVSVANRREHWSKSAARTADHRGTTKVAIHARVAPFRALFAVPGWPEKDAERAGVVVRLTRVYPRQAHIMDSDNYGGSATKAVRDGVVDALCSCSCLTCAKGRHKQCKASPRPGACCVDDSDPRIEWRYDQSLSNTYGLRIELRAKPRS